MRLTSYPLIQFSELIDCPVWDCHTGQILGTVHQIWLDKQLHQVLGLTYQSCLNPSETQSLPWEKVVVVNHEGAWLDVAENTALMFQPKSSIHYRLGNEIWTKTGTLLGTLIDYYFEANTGDIYLYQCLALDDKENFFRVMDISARDLSYCGDRFQIEPTVDSRIPQQHCHSPIIDIVPKFIEQNSRGSNHCSHRDLDFDDLVINPAIPFLSLESINLMQADSLLISLSEQYYYD